MSDWASAFTLFDTLETFFDARIDLIQRTLTKHGDRLKIRAEVAMNKMKSPSGEDLAENLDKEMQKFKLKVQQRLTKLSATWHSTKVVRTREKVSFFFGVMSVFFSALMFGMAPKWVHIAYTLQALYLLPLRAYRYKKRDWHYFLFDLCYYVNILNFLFLWVFPSNAALWVACYCLSHGVLASAVITWRNSLVFHDSDKVTSLFIHVYPPFTFTVIRHFYPGAEQRFPALLEVPHMNPLYAISLSGVLYMIWQMLYWKFVLVNRRKKIESGQRATSFLYLLNAKGSAIGAFLSKFPPQYREAAFMGGQLVYTTFTELPAVFLLYDSPFWSNMFLLFIFSVSVWNGGGFYIEVFGRKFEKELEALRKELAEATARSGRSSPNSMAGIMTDDEDPISPQLSPRQKYEQLEASVPEEKKSQ